MLRRRRSKPVVVGNFFPSLELADGLDEDATISFVDFAIGMAQMVGEHGRALAVDHFVSIPDTEQVGKGAALVPAVAFFLGDDFAGKFQHDGAAWNILEVKKPAAWMSEERVINRGNEYSQGSSRSIA